MNATVERAAREKLTIMKDDDAAPVHCFVHPLFWRCLLWRVLDRFKLVSRSLIPIGR